MTLRRYQQIVAFKEKDTDSLKARYVAFHTDNLEVAEISEEVFASMSPITISSNDAPELNTHQVTSDLEGFTQLENWNNEINPNIRNGEIKFGIRSLTINVTQICNLKCTYCAAGGDGTYGDPILKISIEKTLPQLKYFIDQLTPGKKFNISFVGGEPLLYPEGIEAICHYVSQLCQEKSVIPLFSLTTNATVVDSKFIDLLKTYPINITVSLDGDKETNDQMRPSKNNQSSTEMTIKGLELLNSVRSFIPSLGISAVFNNASQDILTSYAFFKQFSPDWIEFNFAYSQNQLETQAQYINQMESLAELAWLSGGEKELRKIKTFDHYFNLLDSQQRVQNHCGAGKSYLMVDAQNRLYTCPWVVGNKEEVVGSGDYLDKSKLERYQKPLITLNNCQTCWAKYLCGGGCMYIHQSHTGDKHKKDRLFCERTRSLILTAILYYKKARVENESTY